MTAKRYFIVFRLCVSWGSLYSSVELGQKSEGERCPCKEQGSPSDISLGVRTAETPKPAYRGATEALVEEAVSLACNHILFVSWHYDYLHGAIVRRDNASLTKATLKVTLLVNLDAHKLKTLASVRAKE